MFRIIVKQGQAVWIPPGWVHLVLSVETAGQVGLNIIPTQSLPRAITHWRHEVKVRHKESQKTATPCVGLCSCEPLGGAAHFPTQVLQHLRSKPKIHRTAALMIREWLSEIEKTRVWSHICFECNPIQVTLDWLAKRGLKRIEKKRKAKWLKKKEAKRLQKGSASNL